MTSHRLLLEQRLKLAIVLLIIASAMLVLFKVENMLASFVLAFVTNHLLSPFVSALERRGFSRLLSIIIPFLGASILVLGFAAILIPSITDQIYNLESELPRIHSGTLNLLLSTEEKIKIFLNVKDIELLSDMNNWIVSQTAQFSSLIPLWLSQSLTILFLFPFFAFFMLKDGKKSVRTLMSLVPNNVFELFLNIQHQLNDQLGNFVRARLFESLIVAIVVLFGLSILGFPYAFILSFIAGIVNLIPYIGPIIGVIPALLISLISSSAIITPSTWLDLTLICSVYLLAQIIDILFIIPLVVARIVNLHPVSVIISIILGAQLMGIWGMVISIPLASTLKIILTTLFNHLIYRSLRDV